MQHEPETLAEFWPYYLSQHANPTCRALHVAGTCIGTALAAASPLFPPLLIAAPIVAYGMSWTGHFVFERNRPASWFSAKHFVWSFISDYRMTALTLTGKLRLSEVST